MKTKKLLEKYSEGKHWNNHPIIYAEKFADFLERIKFNGFILDLGCGNGRDVEYFRKRNIEAFGIDISEEEIELAEEQYPKSNFEVMNIEDLSYVNNFVDAMFMINVVHYLDKEKAMSEIRRVLRPGGFLFIHFNLEIVDNCGNIDYSQSQEEIDKLVSDFRVVDKLIFERLDLNPIKHTHKILELLLQKRE